MLAQAEERRRILAGLKGKWAARQEFAARAFI